MTYYTFGRGRAATEAAKTHCPQGHPYTPENTYRNPSTGHRHCRICRKANDLARTARKAAAS